MKKGQKIKYDAGYTDNGKDVILTGYIVEVYEGGWVWVAETKEDLQSGLGHSVPIRSIIGNRHKED